MNRTALVRERAALARRQAEIDARLAMMSDAKKTPERRRPRIETTAERSLRRNVDQYMVHLKHAASLLKEYLEEQPKWVDREFVQREGGRRARGRRAVDSWLVIPNGYPGSESPIAMATEFEDATVERLLAAIGELGAIKVMMGMTCTMEKEKIGSDEGGGVGSYVESIHRYGTMATLTNADADAMREFVAYSMAYVIEEFEKFITNGSGWVITAVEKLDLRIDRYHPGRGGSYMACPAWLVNKQCCINIKNEDDNCFRYATTASIDRPKVHPERVHYYKKLKLLKFAGIEMPAPATDTTFKRFETLNPDYALLVYRCPTNGDRDDLCVTYRSPHIKERKMIPLVMLYDAEAKDEVKSHYITVTNVDGLVRKDGNKEATCWYCMHTFAGANAKRCLEQHQQSPCDIQRVELPIKNVSDKLEFTDFEKTLNVPYAIYADFESSLVPIKEEEQQCGGSTQRLNRHVANSFAYTTVGLNGEKIEELSEFFRGPDAGRYCLLGMQRVAEKLKERMQAFRERAPLSPVEEALWEAAEICHLCGKGDMTPAKYKTGQEKPVRLKKDGTPYKVAEPKNVLFPECKVRDHCHITGEYRGAAHSSCNLKARTNYKVPVFIHNLKGYDAHLLMTAMGVTDGKLNIIATNTEKYVSFSLGNLVFKDSCQFLQKSLDVAAKLMPKDEFKQTNALAAEYGLPAELFQRKGTYPYSWVDGGPEKFDQTELPPIAAFHNDLCNEPCTQAEYDHAQNVWKLAGCKNFGDYHDLYLKLDVTILTDVFESFRRSMKKSYGLDPAHYFTLPGFAWSAKLKMTEVKMELLTDLNMVTSIEGMLRGGVCMVSHRHAKANNPRVSGYDASEAKRWLRYDDANNLYGWAMSQKLPVGNFKWGEAHKWTEDRIMAMKDDAGSGAFFCVDLEYPADIHDAHNDFPLCPERMNIPENFLSPYQTELVKEAKSYTDCEKLVPNLRDKSEYWIHYRNLKFALAHGLKLKAIHQVIEFKQAAFMKPFIDFNTKKRTEANSDFEKDLFKLMNNACFGKTMENMRTRRDIQALRTDSLAFKRWVAEPSYKGRKIIDEDLVIAERAFKKIKLFKPIHVGAAVLDLSKLHMWSFWYDYIKPKFGANVRLCYTDTESLVYEITSETDPALEFVGTKGSMFDTSDYPKDHPQHSDDNKKVLGKFKDEAMGVAISEFVGLRPKLYAIRYENAKEIKKSKGTKKSVVEKEIRFDHYKQTLDTRVSMKHSQLSFKSDCHQIFTARVTKTSSSALDTKRYIHEDGITSTAYGHYSHRHIPKIEFKPVPVPLPSIPIDWSKKTCAKNRLDCKGGKFCYHFSASDYDRAEWMAVHGNPRPIPVPALKPVPLAALEPVPIPAPLPVEPTPKPKYQFIPSTYENRGNWFDEPCALRKKNCKGGDKCNHCGGTPRREWYETLREEREVSMYD